MSQNKNFPDYFVIGAPKCATTSLFYFLEQSDEICMPSIKEPQFLVYNGNNNFILSSFDNKKKSFPFPGNINDYKKNFIKKDKSLLIGDYSTHYLYFIDNFISSMKKYYGENYKEIPIVTILRHPVDRAFSHYAMKVRDCHENLSFQESIDSNVIDKRMKNNFLPTFDYIGFSKYKKNINSLLENFNNVLIIDFDDLKLNLKNVQKKLTDFLEIENFKGNSELAVLNKSGRVKNNIVSKFIHYFVFRENILKKMLPKGVKKTVGLILKSKLYKLTLDPVKMINRDYEVASEILKEEIDFYNEIFNKS